MLEVTASNAADYLRSTGRVPAASLINVRELSGGVSNVVLRVEAPGQPPFVIKQSRERLRVAMEWFSRLDRIWTERAALDLLAGMLPLGMVPKVLFEDRDQYLIAMECAPDDAVTWKSQLMTGSVDPELARTIGAALGTIHARAAGHPDLAGIFADTTLFDSLRIDPYYRTVARAHPDLADSMTNLIVSMNADIDRTLVLGDFSPKNILVHERGILLLDFECAHAGDPAFDIGFFFSHLLLKAFRGARLYGDPDRYLAAFRTAWSGYLERSGIMPEGPRARRGVHHMAACLLARLDGKSPVEYRHELDPAAVRQLARDLLASNQTPESVPGLLLDALSH